MNTIDNLMALADAYKDAAESQTYMDQSGSMYQWKVAKEKAEESREALRAALTEALAGKQAQEPIPSIRKTMHTWEKNVLGKLNPSHFGIPQEYCEAAQSYAEFFHSNKLDSVRVSAQALQDLSEIFGGEK